MLIAKKIALSALVVASLTNTAMALDEDASARLAVKLVVGPSSFEDYSSTLVAFGVDSQRYYDNGLMWGTNIEVGGQVKPASADVGEELMPAFDVNVKFGYSFGRKTYGAGIYAILGYGITAYNDYVDTSTQETQFAHGLNYGVGAEYIFDFGMITTANYTIGNRSPQTGEAFSTNKMLIGIGYVFDRR